jgi:magnesium-protoporphyrin IX monomethyl ester (oxidative) cyclase
MLWKFHRIYNAQRQLADHSRPVRYELPQPRHAELAPRDRRQLYIHTASSRGTGLDSTHVGRS